MVRFRRQSSVNRGCLKNEGGSFRNRIGSELAEFVSGCELATVVGFTTWKSASKSVSESCRTWTTQLLFVLSIISELCARYFVRFAFTVPDASKIIARSRGNQ